MDTVGKEDLLFLPLSLPLPPYLPSRSVPWVCSLDLFVLHPAWARHISHEEARGTRQNEPSQLQSHDPDFPATGVIKKWKIEIGENSS